jgi:hypothetical protein
VNSTLLFKSENVVLPADLTLGLNNVKIWIFIGAKAGVGQGVAMWAGNS